MTDEEMIRRAENPAPFSPAGERFAAEFDPPKRHVPTPEQTARDNPAIAEAFGGTRTLAIWLRHLNAR